jgi:hypothetical protein
MDNMSQKNVIIDIDCRYSKEKKQKKSYKNRKKRDKIIIMDDHFLEILLQRDLIGETKNDVMFFCDYAELLAFKSKGYFSIYNWLD